MGTLISHHMDFEVNPYLRPPPPSGDGDNQNQIMLVAPEEPQEGGKSVDIANGDNTVIRGEDGDNSRQLCLIATTGSNLRNYDPGPICKICLDGDGEEKLIEPCGCKGSISSVHRSCLETWLAESGQDGCSICGRRLNLVWKWKWGWPRFWTVLVFVFRVGFLRDLDTLFPFLHWIFVQGCPSWWEWQTVGWILLNLYWIKLTQPGRMRKWGRWIRSNSKITLVPLDNGEYCFPP